ncbi:Wzz/FepE/Etk N-terminal domain-containing protein [Kushneria phosphatilytica]|uniref:Uncharacterized protein n=1 Tax=Kushneria phosphatilytica TaxID=657387 RepID=A0A1S1NXR6_9GAMM|nr:Wzz/FepE/Etk N-terminal domain-containing protein [Kushneria phosphatilytica]OHV09511.1 hypothetical protein BH688_10955 [Kushneria phosphatilytica]QEL11794.1 hypothetical protein FY550_12025 [Kushneria phosphatilytica]
MEDNKPGKKRIISNDEIDLLELWRTLLAGWKTLLFAVVVFLAIGLLSILLSTKEYQASIQVMPAAPEALDDFSRLEVQAAKKDNSNTPSYQVARVGLSPDEAFQRYHQLIADFENFNQFQQTISPEQLNGQQWNESQFISHFSFSTGGKNNPGLEAQYRYSPDEPDAALLAQYVHWSATQARTDLLTQRLEDNADRLDALKEKLESVRQEGIAKRKAELSDLEHAIETAKILGIKEPTTPYDFMSNGPAQTVISNGQWQFAQYFLGTRILQAEYQTLKSHLGEVANDQTHQLEQMIADAQSLGQHYQALAQQSDSAAPIVNVTSQQPNISKIGTKASMILLGCILLGLVVGALIVLLRRAFGRQHSAE